MSTRIDPFEVAPGLMTALFPLEAVDLPPDHERTLAELVRLRASQLNACSYSTHLYTRVALLRGETPARLHALQFWDRSPLFTARERAALAWTDALTKLDDGQVSATAHDEVLRHFSADDLGVLTLQIIAINAWNQIPIGLRLDHRIGAMCGAASSTHSVENLP